MKLLSAILNKSIIKRFPARSAEVQTRSSESQR